MPADAYQPVSDRAIDELANELQPALTAAGDEMSLEEVVALPEATQIVAAWSKKHEVAALRPRGRVASWLLAALERRIPQDR